MSPRGNDSCLTLIRNMKLLWGAERCCMFFHETADSRGNTGKCRRASPAVVLRGMYPAGEVLLPWNGGHGGWGGCSLQDRQVSGELTSWMPGKAWLCAPCLPASHNPLLQGHLCTASIWSPSWWSVPLSGYCRWPSLLLGFLPYAQWTTSGCWSWDALRGASLPSLPSFGLFIMPVYYGVCWLAGSRCWLLGPFSWLFRTCLTLFTYWLWLLS